MNSFLRGLLFGVGVGLLVAPMRGEEMRRLLSQRFQELRGALPSSDQLNQYTQQVSGLVSQTTDSLKSYAQQAASTVKNSANSLSNITQNTASTVKQAGQDATNTTAQAGQNVAGTAKQAGQDLADTAKQAAQPGQSAPASTSMSGATSAPFPSAFPSYVNPELNQPTGPTTEASQALSDLAKQVSQQDELDTPTGTTTSTPYTNE